MGFFSRSGFKRLARNASPQEAFAADGTLIISANVRYARIITPSASLLTPGPCDAILLAADGTTTLLLEEDDTALSMPLRGMVWHPLSASKITAASAVIYAGWFRKPLAV